MRGTAAVLVCLISLHYLSVSDAYTARFTSENGMPGREHEDKHPRRSAKVKRSLSRAEDLERDYIFDEYGPVPNAPGQSYRTVYLDMDRDAYADMAESGLPKTSKRLLDPEDRHLRRAVGPKRGMSPDKPMRQGGDYYDNMEYWGGIPHLPPGYEYRDAGLDASAGADADQNGFSQTLKRLLGPVVEAVRQLWGKLSGKPLDSGAGGDNKREYGPMKKSEMENRDDEGADSPHDKFILHTIEYLVEIAKKALDFATHLINKIDVSALTEEAKKLKEAVLKILQKAKDELEKLLNSASGGDAASSSRRARSVGKRTNARDALESYLTSLRSQKRSKVRSSLRRVVKANAGRASDMTELMEVMTEMEDCISKVPAANTSSLGLKCIVLPLVKVLTSSKLGGANGVPAAADPAVRSDEIDSPDNLRRLNFPWGSIFLIPIYNGPRPDDNTTAHIPDQRANGLECDNATAAAPTTTVPTPDSQTTEFWLNISKDEPDKAVRSDSKYRSKYDSDF